MAILTLEDITGRSPVLFLRTWEQYRDMVEEDRVIIVSGKADTARGDMQVIADSVRQDLETVEAVPHANGVSELRFSWLEDEPSAGQEDYDEETGEPEAPPPAAPQAAVSEPVVPATAGEHQPGAHRTRPLPARKTATHELPPPRSIVTDRDIPGWPTPRTTAIPDDTGHITGVAEPENGHDERRTPEPQPRPRRPTPNRHPAQPSRLPVDVRAQRRLEPGPRQDAPPARHPDAVLGHDRFCFLLRVRVRSLCA